jgi:hypothetical protein
VKYLENEILTAKTTADDDCSGKFTGLFEFSEMLMKVVTENSSDVIDCCRRLIALVKVVAKAISIDLKVRTDIKNLSNMADGHKKKVIRESKLLVWWNWLGNGEPGTGAGKMRKYNINGNINGGSYVSKLEKVDSDELIGKNDFLSNWEFVDIKKWSETKDSSSAIGHSFVFTNNFTFSEMGLFVGMGYTCTNRIPSLICTPDVNQRRLDMNRVEDMIPSCHHHGTRSQGFDEMTRFSPFVQCGLHQCGIHQWSLNTGEKEENEKEKTNAHCCIPINSQGMFLCLILTPKIFRLIQCLLIFCIKPFL